jgi:hypothetical protein
MKKILELIKTYKIQLLIGLVIIFFFRSCSNSSKVTKLERINTENIETIDSLSIKLVQKDSILREEKIKIHSFYDNWVTEKNRGPQLMELHLVIKNNLKEIQKTK